MEAASLIGGVLLVAGFLPRALAGTYDPPWIDVIFVAVGIALVNGTLRGWLRGERA